MLKHFSWFVLLLLLSCVSIQPPASGDAPKKLIDGALMLHTINKIKFYSPDSDEINEYKYQIKNLNTQYITQKTILGDIEYPLFFSLPEGRYQIIKIDYIYGYKEKNYTSSFNQKFTYTFPKVEIVRTLYDIKKSSYDFPIMTIIGDSILFGGTIDLSNNLMDNKSNWEWKRYIGTASKSTVDKAEAYIKEAIEAKKIKEYKFITAEITPP